MSTSVEQTGDFCNPNPVQNFRWVIRSNPKLVDLSKYLIQFGLYQKKIWFSIFLQWSMQFAYPYLIQLSFFEIQSDQDPVLNCRIRLDRDPETGSCSPLMSRVASLAFLRPNLYFLAFFQLLWLFFIWKKCQMKFGVFWHFLANKIFYIDLPDLKIILANFWHSDF